MDVAQVLELVKARLGITTAVRDVYLTAIIEGIIKELTDEKGLVLDGANPYHLMFVVDYATWRYQSVSDRTPAHTGSLRVGHPGRCVGGIIEAFSMSAPEMLGLEKMTKAQLLVFAEEHGISGLNDRMLKADIIAAIQEAMGWM